MPKIEITAQYKTEKAGKDIAYQAEKQWTDRPAWIKLVRRKRPTPRFLSIKVPKYGELIYKAFGYYYYPIDYTNDEERRFMDGMARDYDEMVAGIFNLPMAKALLSRLPLNKLNKKGGVLDLGCGTGIMTELLAQSGFSDFTLVDFSMGMLKQAKKKIGDSRHIRYESLDITKTLPRGKFDLVVSVMLFNTFNNKQTDAILRRLVKQMPQGGIFGAVEDAAKPAYFKYFKPIISEMADVGPRAKYLFVGMKK